MAKNYLKFAEIYDNFSGNTLFYKTWLKFFYNVVNKYGVKPLNILDLACGTGNLSLPLSKKFEVIGLDYSKDMLKILKNKNKQIKTITADMRYFNSPKVDVVISAYDSINYLLTKKDLVMCFKSVHKSLSDKGLFIFDINSESIVFRNAKCNNNWRIFKKYHVLENHKIKNKNLWEINFKIFEKKSKNKYVLFEETHIERAWKIKEINSSLNISGFEVLSITDFNFNNADDKILNKIFFVAKRKKS